ncbi:MAG: DUF5677 domain-containing protein [Gemmatimonadales bacterium]
MEPKLPPISKHLVLDPAYGRDAAQYYLGGALEAGREMVAYGADLLLRSFQTMERTLDNGMLLGVLFRQSIAALDAFMLCLENGAVGAAAVHSRGALEASFYIEFVLRRGKKEWAKRIWVYSLRQNLSWVRRGIPGRPERKQYLEGRKQMGLLPPEPTEEEVQGYLATEQSILERLTADDLRDLNAAFEAVASKKGYEPDWFRPGKDGVSSVYRMACELGRQNEYDTFYRSLSWSVHGSHAFTSAIIQGSTMGIHPVRDLEQFTMVFSFGVNTALKTYIEVIREYRADEQKWFARKYRAEWEDRLRNLPEINMELDPRML